jgi:hypothetical protein
VPDVPNQLPDIVQETLDEDLGIIKQFIDEEINSLLVTDNPEKLLKMPYEQWKDNPQIMTLLQQVYGKSPDSKLNKFVAKKEYAEILDMEKQLGE